jgi:hypothetical protein
MNQYWWQKLLTVNEFIIEESWLTMNEFIIEESWLTMNEFIIEESWLTMNEFIIEESWNKVAANKSLFTVHVFTVKQAQVAWLNWVSIMYSRMKTQVAWSYFIESVLYSLQPFQNNCNNCEMQIVKNWTYWQPL